MDNIVSYGNDTDAATFTVLKDSKSGDTVHIIVAAKHNSKFNLKHYQRVIITIK